ncbi:hypothetical protein M407DRAFT_212410 [Tulasnella calospora MUT 4182]|uniref:NACHT domain-containing protein n=1 Tax=Tulasnella calospora MUT 4182 TaxID=1051891 RepID=A0A0C3KSS2_9AGAM|nr:hypothetical protein M407DRAFT_212410 [Tulasnella calospora MUT 4182]
MRRVSLVRWVCSLQPTLTYILTSFALENTELQAQHRLLLDRLGDGKYGAQGNAIEDVICMPGTRVRILKRIDDAIRNRTIERVMWIHGMAGRGKSTIASTVAHNWKYRAACAIFHFRRGQPMLNRRMICALARQLGNSMVPEVKNAVLESLRENGDIADSRLTHQFTTLFVAPFTKLKNLPYPILIIVDALDECESVKDAVDFVKLIDRYSSSFPPGVKFLLTCRPEAPLLRTLEPRSWPTENLDSAPDVYNDLEQFIKQTCAQIREDHILPEAWPSSEDVRRLVTMSQGLFQWAHTAITYVGDGSPVNRMRAVDSLVLEVAFSKDSFLASVSTDGLVRLWDTETGTVWSERTTKHGYRPGSSPVAFSPDYNLLASSPVDKEIRIWNTQHQRVVGRPMTGHRDKICSLAFSPDGTMLASGSDDHTIRVWDTRTGRAIGEPLEGHWYSVKSLSFSPDGTVLASGSFDHTIRLWDTRTWRTMGKALISHNDVVLSVAWSPDGRLLASASADETVRLWDTQIGRRARDTLEGHTGWVYCVAFSPDGKLLASGADDMTIRLWNSQTGTAAVEPLRGHSEGVESIAFSPDGTTLVSSSWDLTVRLWDIQTSSELLTAHSDPIYSVAFSPCDKVLASGGDMNVQLWDTQTGRAQGEPMMGHSEPVECVMFSPDGKILASGSQDMMIRLWNTHTGSEAAEPLTGHENDVYCLAFSPDSAVLASGSWDGTIRLWDTRTWSAVGKPLVVPSNKDIDSITFSPDGIIVVAHINDGRSFAWDVQTFQECNLPSSPPRHEVAVYHGRRVILPYSRRILWLPSQYWGQCEEPPKITFFDGKLAIVVDHTLSILDISSL